MPRNDWYFSKPGKRSFKCILNLNFYHRLKKRVDGAGWVYVDQNVRQGDALLQLGDALFGGARPPILGASTKIRFLRFLVFPTPSHGRRVMATIYDE